MENRCEDGCSAPAGGLAPSSAKKSHMQRASARTGLESWYGGKAFALHATYPALIFSATYTSLSAASHGLTAEPGVAPELYPFFSIKVCLHQARGVPTESAVPAGNYQWGISRRRGGYDPRMLRGAGPILGPQLRGCVCVGGVTATDLDMQPDQKDGSAYGVLAGAGHPVCCPCQSSGGTGRR